MNSLFTQCFSTEPNGQTLLVKRSYNRAKDHAITSRVGDVKMEVIFDDGNFPFTGAVGVIKHSHSILIFVRTCAFTLVKSPIHVSTA